ncbi:hypothetical protein NDU88_000008 [Pleurodeles waltl]|uniref:Uncharacterized protein n=1 Tax=Pleurodeles waltl TaxID=8319 RepID=A0AAV7S3B6_PLEWA|nr:hypothetical protein NDU88_000008 [Pleurodeles waltl]
MCRPGSEVFSRASHQPPVEREKETLKVGVLPHLEEDIITGTDYAAFSLLLTKAGQEHTLKMWWKEVPYDTREAASQHPRKHLSKRQKRIQRQQYAVKDYEVTKMDPGATGKVYTVAGDFRQSQRDNPSLKNPWQQALNHEEHVDESEVTQRSNLPIGSALYPRDPGDVKGEVPEFQESGDGRSGDFQEAAADRTRRLKRIPVESVRK